MTRCAGGLLGETSFCSWSGRNWFNGSNFDEKVFRVGNRESSELATEDDGQEFNDCKFKDSFVG
jgi:hypothetical protein